MLDDADRLLAAEAIEVPARGRPDPTATREFVRRVGRVDAVGHRVVHGGTRYRAATVIDEEVERYLRSLVDLAPLHQQRSLDGIDLVRSLLPDTLTAAAFDTAFHASMPAAAATYAIPESWRRLGVRRYGFHGLSHAYAARRSARLLGREPQELRTVTAHLGSGASLAAVDRGRSVDTTMGFTPLEGLVMATRSGTVDPAIPLWLEAHGEERQDIYEALDRSSGLVALAGTSDMRELLRRRAAREEAASLAFDVYIHRLRALVAAMAAAMGGLDVLTFTGGVGEAAPEVRSAAVDGLRFLGLSIDEVLNRAARADAVIGQPAAPVATLVVSAREDVEVARQVRELLAGGAA